MKTKTSKFFKSVIAVSHIEFQSYDFQRHEIICSSGLAQQVLGYTKEEFFRLGKDYFKAIIHPDDHAKVLENIEQIIHSAEGEIIEMTARLRKSDGEYLWIYTRKIITTRDSKGYPCTITTIAEDITEFILLQHQLREKIAQMEIVSWKNSHMLRSPVASIIGLVNLIEEKHIMSAHNMQIFNFMKQAIEKLDQVIHEIENDLQGK